MHRARLIANYLPDWGWHPVVVTVKEEYYEEAPDADIVRTVSGQVEVHKTGAFPVLGIFGRRLIGDIGLRGFFQMYRKAREIIRARRIDFVWIPIPSWYPALLGRLLHERTSVPYGIDYIDPWVSKLAPHERPFSRAWWTNTLARVLEPVAVKKAALITGVSAPYYQGVLDRNFQGKPVVHAAMPYGFDPRDHDIELPGLALPWPEIEKALVYAGAFLPQSHLFIDQLFAAVRELKEEGRWDRSIKLYFLGTGHYQGRRISNYAAAHGLSGEVVEVRERFPYLHILHFLSRAHGVMVIGSTERHYTASKTFQSLLSKRPVFAVFHEASSAVRVMEECRADDYTVRYREGMEAEELRSALKEAMGKFTVPNATWSPDLAALGKYSARESARVLAEGVGRCLEGRENA